MKGCFSNRRLSLCQLGIDDAQSAGECVLSPLYVDRLTSSRSSNHTGTSVDTTPLSAMLVVTSPLASPTVFPSPLPAALSDGVTAGGDLPLMAGFSGSGCAAADSERPDVLEDSEPLSLLLDAPPPPKRRSPRTGRLEGLRKPARSLSFGWRRSLSCLTGVSDCGGDKEDDVVSSDERHDEALRVESQAEPELDYPVLMMPDESPPARVDRCMCCALHVSPIPPVRCSPPQVDHEFTGPTTRARPWSEHISRTGVCGRCAMQSCEGVGRTTPPIAIPVPVRSSDIVCRRSSQPCLGAPATTATAVHRFKRGGHIFQPLRKNA